MAEMMAVTGEKYLESPAKRRLDVVGSVAIGSGLSLAAAATAIVSMVEHRQWNPFFSQERVGKDGQPITIHKFETLQVASADAEIPVLGGSDHHYASKIAKFIRRKGLDEIPQLYDVLRGKLHLVGPRPIPEDHYEAYSQIEALDGIYETWRDGAARFPGLIGWSQLYMKQFGQQTNETLCNQLYLDDWYYRHASLALDLRILAKTPLRMCGLTQPPQPLVLLPEAT